MSSYYTVSSPTEQRIKYFGSENRIIYKHSSRHGMDGIWIHCCVICINIGDIPPQILVIYNEKIKYLFSLLSIVNKLNAIRQDLIKPDSAVLVKRSKEKPDY